MEAKMCPFLSVAARLEPQESEPWVSCQGDQCAWWQEGQCSLVTIAQALGEISDSLLEATRKR